MREIVDPFKGIPYSAILDSLTGDRRKAYREAVPPLRRIAGTGKASWDSEIGRYVI